VQHWISTRLLVLGCGLGLAILAVRPGAAVSQDGKPPPRLPADKDPTKPSPILKDKLDPKTDKETPSTSTSSAPRLALRGRVLAANQPPAALLEIDGQVRLVRKDDKISGGGRIVYRIVEISRNEVRIEIQPLNEVVTLQ